MKEICRYLSGNSYPGRGIIMGNRGGKRIVAYFIMGRSLNSRNRVFARDGDSLRTKAFDESLMSDPSLIIYYPVRTSGDSLIVTNGDQTDTIRDFLSLGKTFEEALRTREYEPDRPNYTPRISGILLPDGSFRMSILKAGGEGPGCLRYFYEYPARDGYARIIHTYRGDGDPIPSFEGEPPEFPISGDSDEIAEKLWERLDRDNKVSLFVRVISPDGSFRDRIINKREEEK